jgi:hypothetical protein
MRCLSAIVLLALCIGANAQVYKIVDKNGNVIFSDKPAPGAKEIYVPPVQTYSVPKPKVATPAAAASKKPANAPVSYKIAISSPADDETVRQNEGDLAISVRIEPDLREPDKIEFLMDGKAIGKPSSETSTVVKLVPRGTHTIGARIIGGRGAVRATAAPITVHMKRFFRNP